MAEHYHICFIIAFLGLLMAVVMQCDPCELFDRSTQVACAGAVFPEVGRGVCYKRTVSPDKCNPIVCELQPIERNNRSIKFSGNRYTIHSPQFFKQDASYQDKRFCQYHIPPCPDGTVAQLEWTQNDFVLEPPQQSSHGTICLDYVQLLNLDLGGLGVELNFGRLCGNPISAQLPIPNMALMVEFGSDTSEKFRGFRMDVVCTPKER